MQALLPVPEDLGMRHLGFGIGTPFAPQRTSFKKDNGADAWAVVNAEFLDIKYVCFHLKQFLLTEVWSLGILKRGNIPDYRVTITYGRIKVNKF